MTGAMLRVRVARVRTEAQDVRSYELVAADGGALPPFTAGAHVDVRTPDGPMRQYSLCGDPRDTGRYVIAVLREPASRGGSHAMHDRVAEGELLEISAPRNLFALAPGARRSLLLAGGIGITPLLAMAEQLAAEGADFALHCANRTPARAAFADRLQGAPFAGRTHMHFDDGPADQRLDLAALLASPAAGTHLYVCGPSGFMEAVLAAARARGWPEDRLHWESFVADVAPRADEGAFRVRLASSGQVVDVPADRSVVQALAAAGIDVMVSCEQGICGTCQTRVLEGTPDHRDSYLTPEEQAAGDLFLPCCSRAKSPELVIDL